MRITIVCVGKIKEKFYRDALAEYIKRLGRYCKPEIVEVADEQTPDKSAPALEEQIKQREAERILGRLKEDMYVCTLEIAGKKLTSEQFSSWLEKSALSGKSHIAFVIGGSLGLHDSVIRRSECHLSFSDMTFPHQLMRVILCEQIYRAFRIMNGEPYHK